MEITTKNLIKSIKALVKDQDINEVLDIVLTNLSEEELQNVIQVILDPTYNARQDVLTNPARFTSTGELVGSV